MGGQLGQGGAGGVIEAGAQRSEGGFREMEHRVRVVGKKV